MYIYVCLCMSMYICIYLCMSMYIYVYLYISMYVYICLCMSVYVYVCLCNVCVYLCISPCANHFAEHVPLYLLEHVIMGLQGAILDKFTASELFILPSCPAVEGDIGPVEAMGLLCAGRMAMRKWPLNSELSISCEEFCHGT